MKHVNASTLAQMDKCETLVVLNHRWGKRSSARLNSAARNGEIRHETHRANTLHFATGQDKLSATQINPVEDPATNTLFWTLLTLGASLALGGALWAL